MHNRQKEVMRVSNRLEHGGIEGVTRLEGCISVSSLYKGVVSSTTSSRGWDSNDRPGFTSQEKNLRERYGTRGSGE